MKGKLAVISQYVGSYLQCCKAYVAEDINCAW